MPGRILKIPRGGLVLAAVLVGAVAVYALLGFFVVPRVARAQATEFVERQLGLKLAVGRIAFNPFTLAARIDAFAITERDGAPLVRFDALRVNAEVASLWHRGLVLRELSVDGPAVEAILARDGRLNLARLRPPPDSAGKSVPDAEPTAVRIGTLAIRAGRVAVEDRTRARPFRAVLAPIEIALSDFRTEPGHANAYRFRATSSDQEELDWSGSFTVRPLGSTGNFTVTRLRAATVASYLQQALPFDLAGGEIDLRGEYRIAAEETLRVDVGLPSVVARDLAAASKAYPGKPLVKLPALEIAGAKLALTGRRFSIDALRLRGAEADVWREVDGALNLTTLLDAGPAPAPAAAWSVNVGSVEVSDARVTLEDRGVTPAARIALSGLRLVARGYSNAPGARLSIEGDTAIDGSARLAVSGQLTLEPLSADAKLTLEGFSLQTLQPYLARDTDVTIEGGELGFTSQVKLEPGDAAPRVHLSADVGVDGFATRENARRQELVKWRQLRVAGLEYSQAQDLLTIRSITAKAPFARVIIAEDGVTNIARALRLPAGEEEGSAAQPPPAQTPARAEPRMQVRIGTVAVDDASASFADQSIEPSFAAAIVGLRGSVRGLSSSENSRARVELRGSVDRYAPVTIVGEINPFASAVYSDVAMTFSNIDLTTFNPYSGKFAGYNIAKGKLTTELHYKVANRKLDAQHHIVVDQLEFGAATDSKEAVPVPIKLAVALLKDRHGVIDLDLPVTGDLDDPKFRVGPIIWKMFVNLLTKIVTSPFTLLARLGGGGDEMSYVDFEAGSSQLAAAEAEKLGKLAAALVERPQLRLDVPLSVVGPADSVALAQRAFDAVLAPEASSGENLKPMLALYRQKLGSEAKFDGLVAGREAPVEERREWLRRELLASFASATSGDMDTLGRARAEAVKDALLGNGAIAPERVFLTSRASAAEAPAGKLRMELKVE